jgi:hypothetical protein
MVIWLVVLDVPITKNAFQNVKKYGKNRGVQNKIIWSQAKVLVIKIVHCVKSQKQCLIYLFLHGPQKLCFREILCANINALMYT